MSDDLTPGQGHLGPEVDRFDERADELLDLLRGQKTDQAFPPNPDKAVMNQ